MNNQLEDKIIKERISIPLLILNIVLVSVVFSFIFMIAKVREDSSVKNISEDKSIKKPIFLKIENIKAKSVYVLDVKSGEVLYSKNEKEKMPLASLTKIMTAFTALEIMPKDKVISIDKDFLKEEGDTGLLGNEKWTLYNLLSFTLSVSSNDGAKSIASVSGAFHKNTKDLDEGRSVFIQKMNKLSIKNNLNSLYFRNETGLDKDGFGGVGSAEDISKLFAIVLKKYPDVFESSRKKEDIISSLQKDHLAKNTNEYVDKIPNILASKTGFTEGAGGNLIVSFDAGIGRPIIITVLGSTIDDRFSDVIKIASSTLGAIVN